MDFREKDKHLDKVIEYFSNQISTFIETKIKQEGFEEGIEMDILLRALFIQISKKQKLEKFKNSDLEWMLSKSFNEYAATMNLNMYAKDYVDPDKTVPN